MFGWSADQLAPGKWLLKSQTGYDSYLAVTGANPASRAFASVAKAQEEFQIDPEGTWRLKSDSCMPNPLELPVCTRQVEVTFRPGGRIKDVAPDAQDTYGVSGNKLVQLSKPPGGPVSIITRAFERNVMTQTMHAEGVTATRRFLKEGHTEDEPPPPPPPDSAVPSVQMPNINITIQLRSLLKGFTENSQDQISDDDVVKIERTENDREHIISEDVVKIERTTNETHEWADWVDNW